MANPLSSSQFMRLMDDRLRKVYADKYKFLPSMVDQLFGVISSDKAWEEFFGIGAVPDIVPFNGKLQYLSVAPDFYTRIEPKQFAGAISIERSLLDNDRYGVIKNRQDGLVDAEHRVREKYGVQPFANAFSSAFTFMPENEEGVSLCSTAHLSKSDISTSAGFSNSGTSALNKTNIQAIRIIMRQFRDNIGERIGDIDPDLILVPDALYSSTCEALGYDPETGADSSMDPESANRKINSMYKRFKVLSHRLLDDYDTNNWFMIDSKKMKQYLMWINRIAPEIETTRDFETKQFKQSIYTVWGHGFTDWRWIYGCNVS
jgi:phage major head subunit gpT-like protein